MATWTLAQKDLRLLLRDRRALVILLAMPLIFILVLGVSLGEGFYQKPDDRLQVSIVDLDKGEYDKALKFPGQPWSSIVQGDLTKTAGIRLEVIGSREEAEALVRGGKRSAVLIFGPDFSKQVARCSFLEDGINPFYHDGVKLQIVDVGHTPGKSEVTLKTDGDVLDVFLLRDPTQLTTAAIIEQVAQVSLLRVVMPWMIGRAFEKIGDKDFIESLGEKMVVPVPVLGPTKLKKLLTDEKQKLAVGSGVQTALQELFSKYDLTAKTWDALTRSEPKADKEVAKSPRGDLRYQYLVPSYTVMFAFFLVLTVGWLFVGERRQGTLKRLRAAALSRSQILGGKMVPCFLLSLGQGLFLLGAGKLAFHMNWGPYPFWLLPVVVTTSIAAMGLALLVASVARTETQVAIYGTLLVLVLAGISGCLMPRDLMPETMKQLSRVTPHAWALDAYMQLLVNPDPNLQIVGQACAVLTAFGIGFLALAWWFLALE